MTNTPQADSGHVQASPSETPSEPFARAIATVLDVNGGRSLGNPLDRAAMLADLVRAVRPYVNETKYPRNPVLAEKSRQRWERWNTLVENEQGEL